MTQAQVIVLATPVLLMLIVLEFTVARLRGCDTYCLPDTLAPWRPGGCRSAGPGSGAPACGPWRR